MTTYIRTWLGYHHGTQLSAIFKNLEMSSLPELPEKSLSSADAAAAALARASEAPKQKSATQLIAEHDRRQAFRRLIDPGILRPNSKEQASSSLKVNPF